MQIELIYLKCKPARCFTFLRIVLTAQIVSAIFLVKPEVGGILIARSLRAVKLVRAAIFTNGIRFPVPGEVEAVVMALFAGVC